jgi:hypothetical protein
MADGNVRPIPGHNMTSATLGTLILWLGWFGFNPGSTMAADPDAIALVALNTSMAAAAGCLAATAAAWILLGKPDLSMILNGTLAGLVAITAPCAFVGVGSSVVIGLLAGVIVVYSVLFFDRVKIDDPVGALSVHLVNGAFGTLAVGLFATDGGLFFGGGFAKTMTQLVGIGAVGAMTFVASLAVWLAIKAVIGVRVSRQEELEGLLRAQGSGLRRCSAVIGRRCGINGRCRREEDDEFSRNGCGISCRGCGPSDGDGGRRHGSGAGNQRRLGERHRGVRCPEPLSVPRHPAGSRSGADDVAVRRSRSEFPVRRRRRPQELRRQPRRVEQPAHRLVRE